MAVRVSCPYCNAVVEADGRTTCPRCGEAFDAATAEPAAGEAPVAVVTSAPKPSFLYSRGAVFLSLGLAAVILVGGLAVVRPWEAKTPPRAEVKLPVVVSPLGLSGLTFLPPGTNVVAAVQPMPLLAYAAVNKIDPRKFLVETGVPDDVLAKLGQAGVSLDQIDHAVVGVAVSSEAGTIPDVTACLKLTRPLADEGKFLTQLKAEKNSQQSKGGRTVYSLQLGLPFLLTRVDDRTYLFALDAKAFAVVDKPLPPGGGHLPPALRDAITTRVSPASFAWLATDSVAWTENPSLKPLLGLAPALKERLPKLAAFRSVAAGLSMEPDPQLRLAVRTAAADATARVQGFLKDTFTAPSATFAGDADWAAVQSPFDPKTTPLRPILEGAMAGKP